MVLEFIKLNNAIYDFLMLFIKKLKKNQRFYINYKKLNAIIKKNKYLLLFIGKTLKRISKTKIFIKLNIRQAFYYICIFFKLKNFIIFKIRYKNYKIKVLPFKLYNGFLTF